MGYKRGREIHVTTTSGYVGLLVLKQDVRIEIRIEYIHEKCLSKNWKIESSHGKLGRIQGKGDTTKANDTGSHGKPGRIQGKGDTTKANDTGSHGKPRRIQGKRRHHKDQRYGKPWEAMADPGKGRHHKGQ